MCEIKCVGDFLKVVGELSPENKKVFYRGQGDSSYDINSTLYRLLNSKKLKPIFIKEFNSFSKGYVETDVSKYGLAGELFNEFQRKHVVYSDVNILREYKMNDIDLHVTAQHYGLATRVIDWSVSPLVALYFAVERDNNKESSVYMIWDEPVNRLEVCSSDNFLNRLEAEKSAHVEAYALINDFVLKYYDFNTGLGSSKADGMVWDLKAKLFDKISSLKLGAIMKMNAKFHPLDVFMPKLDSKVFFDLLLSFLNEGKNNYNRPVSSIDIHSSYKTIVEPLPINQRVKNQQGVLMFSNVISEIDYLNSSFNQKNSIRKLADLDSKDFQRSLGVYQINIPGEFKKSIKRELNSYGFTKEFIYPELMSFTESMQEKIVAGRIQ